jgi:hypothetical protein
MTNRYYGFNKIDAYKHLTIDEDDLMTEKRQDITHRRVESDLDEPVGEKMHCLFRQQTKEFRRV